MNNHREAGPVEYLTIRGCGIQEAFVVHLVMDSCQQRRLCDGLLYQHPTKSEKQFVFCQMCQMIALRGV